jgi:hypothetical protein
VFRSFSSSGQQSGSLTALPTLQRP